MPISMSGSALRKTTVPGTISTRPATSMPRPRPRLTEAQRKLAFEEILIAEGSDWNWWYGPEHHSANDREFDELYRKHLSNIYQLLGQPRRRTIWRNRSSGGGARPAWCRRRPIFIPASPETWCAISSGWGRRCTPPTGAPAQCTVNNFCSTRYMPESTYSTLYGRLDFTENKAPESRFRTGGQPGVLGESEASGRAKLPCVSTSKWSRNVESPSWKAQRSRRSRPLCGL